MSVLDGHQFTAAEIEPVLVIAANDAINAWNANEDTTWLSANVNLAGTKIKVNKMALDEGNPIDPSAEPVLIRKGNPLWTEIDAVLAPLIVFDDVKQAINDLPRDVGTMAASADWIRPVTAVGLLAALAGFGYWWAHKGAGRRR